MGIAILLATLASLPAVAAEPIVFEAGAIAEWPRRNFDGEVTYRLAEIGGRSAVEAIAEDGATALYHEVEVDLARTPVLEWSWRIDDLPSGEAGERTKAGDDYAARIYIVREGLFGKLSARALNYVWSRALPPGTEWPNAYTQRNRMIAVASGAERAGQWVTHRRDVRADWHAAFGEAPGHIHGICIMTDSDNTDSRARALYGRIRFLPAPED